MSGTTTAPFLQTLSARAWASFLDEWEAYRARGGRSPVRHCVSSTVLKVIELRLPTVAAERESNEESQVASSSDEAVEQEAAVDGENLFLERVSSLLDRKSVV